MVDIKEVLENLCYYNERNPYNQLEFMEDQPEFDKGNRGQCCCNNCFYGRTKLAEYILKLLNEKV